MGEPKKIKVGVWLDDFRDPSRWSYRDLFESCEMDEVVWAQTYEEFQEEVLRLVDSPSAERVLHALFFDNDLGDPQGREGRHAFTWFEGTVREKNLPRVLLHAQTANPAARRELHLGFESLERFWNALE